MIQNLLRPMTTEDLDVVLTWRNHPSIRNFMYTNHEISFDEHLNWFELCAQNPAKHLLIYDMCGIPAGFVHFAQLNSGAVADWGFYLAPEAPKGIGSAFGYSALEYGFNKLGLYKICGQALEFNDRSIRFHLRLGFNQEGLLKDQHYDGKRYISILSFGLLKCTWANMYERSV